MGEKYAVKYEKSVYEQTEFFDPDEEIRCHAQKIVKVRKDHDCCQCGETIEKGSMALRESGYMEEGPCQAYSCIPCCDKWLDEIKGEEA